MSKPKILTIDIETSPIVAYTWGLFDQNVGLNQIKEDWHLLSWSAKWLGEKKVYYMDNRKAKDISDDKKLVQGIVNLINEADIIVSQNGISFDMKKINARAVINGLPPVKKCRQTDILREGKKVFKFTSHRLEYVTEKLNKKYKKLKHGKYPGFELWKAIMKGDIKAWKEMETYNKHDVLATEETYLIIQGWIKTHNLAAYSDDLTISCTCGSTDLIKKGFVYTDAGKYQGYKCKQCGSRPRGKVNLLSTEKKRSMLRGE